MSKNLTLLQFVCLYRSLQALANIIERQITKVTKIFNYYNINRQRQKSLSTQYTHTFTLHKEKSLSIQYTKVYLQSINVLGNI